MDTFKKELIKKSEETKHKVKQEMTVDNKIKLITNQITPDNFDKKFHELRQLMFGDMKVPGEAGYDRERDRLTQNLNVQNMNMIVQTIFKKAQNEKQYCQFYGDLCERLIRLELTLKDKKLTVANLKQSEFRETLLKHCKASFETFFSKEFQEKRRTLDENDEEYMKLKSRLMGNIKFVGELNRRNLLSESILISIFDMLLGVNLPG